MAPSGRTESRKHPTAFQTNNALAREQPSWSLHGTSSGRTESRKQRAVGSGYRKPSFAFTCARMPAGGEQAGRMGTAVLGVGATDELRGAHRMLGSSPQARHLKGGKHLPL